MKKKYSLRRLIMQSWALLMNVVVLLPVFYGVYLVRRNRGLYLNSLQYVADSNALLLSKDIYAMQETVNAIFANDASYRQLKQRSLSDYDQIHAMQGLRDSMNSQVGSIDYDGGLYYYDAGRGAMRSLYSNREDEARLNHLNSALIDYLIGGEGEIRRSGQFLCDGELYYSYCIVSQEKYLGCLINLTRYFPREEGTAIYYVTDGRVTDTSGREAGPGEAVLEAASDGEQRLLPDGTALAAAPVEHSAIKLAFVSSTGNELSLFRQPPFWMLIIFTPAVTLLFLLWFLRILRNTLLSPVEHIANRAAEIQRHIEHPEEEEVHTAEDEKVIEYAEINRRIDETLLRVSELQRARHREEQRANEAQLQYYQLQVNPHFFLNCLNNISTLLESRKTEAADSLIRDLSTHFRYVFQRRTKLVTVAEEIREIRAYCNIYAVKGGSPVLFQADVKTEAENLAVPILGIQTFVENSIKHQSQGGQILQIKVQARLSDDEQGEKQLRVTASDNGSGYSEENLAEFNAPVEDYEYRGEHVGIANLKARMHLIYGDKAQLYFYNGPYGGACMELALPAESTEN